MVQEMKTLVDRIKYIKNMPDFIEMDINQQLRDEFERMKQYNPVVASVMDGTSTFESQYMKIFGRDEIDRTKLSYLEDCIGKYKKPHHLPVFSGVIGLAFGGIASLMVYKESEQLSKDGITTDMDIFADKHGISRRNLLRLLTFLAIPAATTTATTVGGEIMGNYHMRQLKQNTQYLDEVYARAFK